MSLMHMHIFIVTILIKHSKKTFLVLPTLYVPCYIATCYFSSLIFLLSLRMVFQAYQTIVDFPYILNSYI